MIICSLIGHKYLFLLTEDCLLKTCQRCGDNVDIVPPQPTTITITPTKEEVANDK